MMLIEKDKYDRLCVALERAREIFSYACMIDDELIWRDAYDAIFEGGICRIIHKCIPNFEWYDPDTTYKEDVCAFMYAIKDFEDKSGMKTIVIHAPEESIVMTNWNY